MNYFLICEKNVMKQIILIIFVVISLPFVGIMFLINLIGVINEREWKRFEKFLRGELGEQDWKDGEKEKYKKWLGY